MGEEGREDEVFGHLLRLRDRGDLPRPARRRRPVRLHRALRRRCDASRPAPSSRPPTLLAQLGATPGLAAVLDRLGVGEDNVSPGQVAAAVEFVLEGLHLTRRLSKDSVDGRRSTGADA